MNEQGRPVDRRFIAFASILALGVLALLIRYAFLMMGTVETIPSLRTELVSGRGPILDRNGNVLAMEIRTGNITLWRPSMKDPSNPAELSNELAPILEIPANEIEERIVNSRSDFVYLKRYADESTIRLIEAAQAEKRLQGVNIEPMLSRVYPENNLAAQIIGFTAVSIQDSEEFTGTITATSREGVAGIEFAFNKYLTPSIIPSLLGDRNYQNGDRIYLTLDINVQLTLENIASRIMNESNAEAVIFMAMDPRTGDILGSASLPGFNPNDISSSNEISRMDRPSIWSYEPGSTFKIFSLSALLDEGAIKEDTIFVCNGFYEGIDNQGRRYTINCLGSHGAVTARDIIVHSCNAGAAYAADQMNTNLFSEILREFGFGSRTGLGIPAETAGFFRSADRWTYRSKPTIAMGQEIAVSALQMLQAASAIANNGILIPPKIISRIVSWDGKETRDYDVGQPRQVLRPETAQAMRSYMMDVTSDIGTGWRANMEDLSLAVKTGTAQMIDSQTGRYSDTDFIASCIAFLPAENPSLILYLAIIKPQGEYLGGRIAAPPIREAADELINYLGIPRGNNPQITHSGTISIPQLSYPEINDTVPDFIGYSKRQLLPLLLREDLYFRIMGDGWVRRQSPAAGSPLRPDTVIVLELE
jgi:cell division protein FtsI (penicillin-binding protein 3)